MSHLQPQNDTWEGHRIEVENGPDAYTVDDWTMPETYSQILTLNYFPFLINDCKALFGKDKVCAWRPPRHLP